jgi:hypothetical protein
MLLSLIFCIAIKSSEFKMLFEVGLEWRIGRNLIRCDLNRYNWKLEGREEERD